jgi:hypothetical protein
MQFEGKIKMQTSFQGLQRPSARAILPTRGVQKASFLPKFGADKLDKPAFQENYPLLSQHVFAGQAPEERPLTQRDWSKGNLYREYREMIRRQNFDYHYRGPIPFIHTISKISGAIALVNPLAFNKFKHDENGQLECALIINGNERAFEHGLLQPSALMKQGKFAEAVRSFQTALDAAPSRRAETYETLGNMCAMLDRFQRDMELGFETMTHELEEELEFYALNSSLRSNNITPEKGKESKMGFSYSSSMLSRGHWRYKQPINWEAFRKGLSDKVLPFRELAHEAYRKAAELEATETDYGNGHKRPNEYKQWLNLKALWMAGDLTGAIAGFNEILAGKREDGKFLGIHPESMKPLIYALKEAGRLDEAVEVMGELLNEVYSGNFDEAHYVELVNLCHLKAQVSPESDNGWAIALPYLKAGVNKLKEYDSDRWLPRLYLAKAYEALNQPEDALEIYTAASEGALAFSKRVDEEYQPTALKRYDELQAKIAQLKKQIG